MKTRIITGVILIAAVLAWLFLASYELFALGALFMLAGLIVPRQILFILSKEEPVLNEGVAEELLTQRGTIACDEMTFRTSMEDVFAAGDVVHGSLTVVHAVEEAKNAAAGMIAYMEEEK